MYIDRQIRNSSIYFTSFSSRCLAEGFFNLWRGASLNVLRAVLMTLSQVILPYLIKLCPE